MPRRWPGNSMNCLPVCEGVPGTAFWHGPHQCVAVKVIDPRGNEVMAVIRIHPDPSENAYGQRQINK